MDMQNVGMAVLYKVSLASLYMSSRWQCNCLIGAAVISIGTVHFYFDTDGCVLHFRQYWKEKTGF